MQRKVANPALGDDVATRWLIFLLGFSIPFPGLLLPGATYSPRYTDLVVCLCIPVAWNLYNRTVREGNVPFKLSLWLAAVIVPAVVHYLTFGNFVVADYVYYMRWILAIVLAIPLAQVLPERPRLQQLLLLGIVAGAGLHVMSIWVASIGGKSALIALGFASPRVHDTGAFGAARITSLSEHANGAMILIAMAVPAAVSYRLISEKDKGLWTIAVALACLIAGFYFTLTRSATLAAVVALAIGLLQFFKRGQKSTMAFRGTFAVLAVLMILLALQASSFEVGQDRLAERIASKGLAKNLDGRAHTVEATVNLLMQYPFGTGWSQFLRKIVLADGLSASHNGYLFTARVMGIPLALLIAFGHARLLWRMASTRRIDALPPLACFLVVVMFAEDVTQGMSLVFLATLLAVCGYNFKPWASVIYRSALVPPVPASARRSPSKTVGLKPSR